MMSMPSTPAPSTAVPEVLYEESFTFPDNIDPFPMSNARRDIEYAKAGWCGNNAGATFCLFDEGGEGTLGNDPRPGDTNSAFAFVSETGQNASGFAFTNPDFVGPFSTDDVKTLS